MPDFFFARKAVSVPLGKRTVLVKSGQYIKADGVSSQMKRAIDCGKVVQVKSVPEGAVVIE